MLFEIEADLSETCRFIAIQDLIQRSIGTDIKLSVTNEWSFGRRVCHFERKRTLLKDLVIWFDVSPFAMYKVDDLEMQLGNNGDIRELIRRRVHYVNNQILPLDGVLLFYHNKRMRNTNVSVLENITTTQRDPILVVFAPEYPIFRFTRGTENSLYYLPRNVSVKDVLDIAADIEGLGEKVVCRVLQGNRELRKSEARFIEPSYSTINVTFKKYLAAPGSRKSRAEGVYCGVQLRYMYSSGGKLAKCEPERMISSMYTQGAKLQLRQPTVKSLVSTVCAQLYLSNVRNSYVCVSKVQKKTVHPVDLDTPIERGSYLVAIECVKLDILFNGVSEGDFVYVPRSIYTNFLRKSLRKMFPMRLAKPKRFSMIVGTFRRVLSPDVYLSEYDLCHEDQINIVYDFDDANFLGNECLLCLGQFSDSFTLENNLSHILDECRYCFKLPNGEVHELAVPQYLAGFDDSLEVSSILSSRFDIPREYVYVTKSSDGSLMMREVHIRSNPSEVITLKLLWQNGNANEICVPQNMPVFEVKRQIIEELCISVTNIDLKVWGSILRNCDDMTIRDLEFYDGISIEVIEQVQRQA